MRRRGKTRDKRGGKSRERILRRGRRRRKCGNM